MFDLDDDGYAERAGWVGPHDGLLVHDADHDGTVDGVAELLGSANVDGYDELKTLDANNDGRIDAADPAFADLLIWRDANSDGFSTPDEMLTPAQAGIARLNLAYAQTDVDVDGNVVARTGTYVRTDGSSRAMASVQFALDESGNRPVFPEEAELGSLPVLPNLTAAAATADLKTAMFFDPTLKAMVEDLVYGDHDFDTFQEFADEGFIDVLYRWAGVDASIPPEPGRPYYLKVFEALTGVPLEVTNDHQRQRLEDLWPDTVKHLGLQFLVQAANNPPRAPFLELAEALSTLDPGAAGFSDSVAALTDSAIIEAKSIIPAYVYLTLFGGVSLDPSTGEISGDFDAVVAGFLEDQPSFYALSSSVSGGGGGPTMGGSLGEHRHPWTAWYEDQGSLLFTIAGAMGIGPDYVLSATGWRWLHGEITRHEGGAGSDLLDFTVTYWTRVVEVSGPGGTATQYIQVPTRDQLLFGYEGNDELRGNDGVDRLVGGTGDDLLKGGAGSDMYVWAAGDGLDRIVDAEGAEDAIYFSSELDREDLRVVRISGTNDLMLHFGDASQGLILAGQWGSRGAAVEQFHFVAEDGLDAGDVASLWLATLATAGADAIAGSWAGERIDGLDGDDNLSGLDGDDRIDGGAGNDVLSGGGDHDLLLGGPGNDLLTGAGGHDALQGGPGDDRLQGNDGRDTYLYAAGDGDDVLLDFSGERDNRLVFGAGIAPADILFSRGSLAQHVRIGFAGQPGSILIENQWWHDAGVESIAFADGTIWNEAQLAARYVAAQSSGGNDTIWGSNLSDVGQGGAGDDLVQTHGGTDTLIGGSGNDRLEGGVDGDTYVYDAGDGDDVVHDFQGSRNNRLQFGPGITPADILFSRGGLVEHARIGFAGQPGSILLERQWWHDAGIESISFADGTVWNEAEIAGRYVAAQATAGNDTIWGSNLADFAQGGAGDDLIQSYGGGDTLIGGSGNDRLEGGVDGDTYVYDAGDGDDVVHDFQGSRNNRLQFGAGIAPAEIVFSRGGLVEHARIGFAGQPGSILIERQWWHDAGIESIVFADGTIWNEAEIAGRYVAAQATAGNDVIWGSNLADFAQGGDGDDLIQGHGGHDILLGGSGNDRLEGGEGNDHLTGGLGDDYFEGGPGNDALIGEAGNDVMLGGPGGDNLIGGDGSDYMNGGGEADYFEGGGGDDALIGEGGNDILLGGSGGDNLIGGDGSDYMNGGDDADYFEGGSGNDALEGEGGNDVILGGAGGDNLIGGGGNDYLGGGDDSDYFDGGDGDDALQGEGGHDILLGGAGSDNLIGGAGDDYLGGGDGDDYFEGGGGHDSLEGGAGTNILIGGDGADAFLFLNAPAAGFAHVVDFAAGTDRLVLDDAAFGLPLGPLSPDAFRTGTGAQDLDDRIVYNPETGALLFDSDGTGAAAPVQIASLVAGLPLGAGDFLVI